MSRVRVRIELGTPEDCVRHWREYLSKGGAYATGDTPEDVEVIVVLARRGCPDLELDAKTVYRMGGGTGYELLGWNDGKKEEIEAWCHLAPEAEPEPETEPEPEPETESEPEGDEEKPGRPRLMVNALAERLRHLPQHQQTKLAREGDQRERVMLERLYGKNVWEALLRNPRISPPEVARIARMGTLPVPLVELIVSNGGWLRNPEIRRALLQNLRLGSEMIPRVLRMLPKHELKLVPTQTAYPPAVRDLARRLLRGVAGED